MPHLLIRFLVAFAILVLGCPIVWTFNFWWWHRIDLGPHMELPQLWSLFPKMMLSTLPFAILAGLMAIWSLLRWVALPAKPVPDSRSISTYTLFTDVVAYSERTNDEQLAIIREMNAIVKWTLSQARMAPERDYVALPTGDGMAICLVNNPPVEIAGYLARQLMAGFLASRMKFAVRLGLHCTQDWTYTDINGRLNIAGAGINWTARIMRKAEPGQILVSYAAYQRLFATSTFRDALRSIGPQVVKHGKKEEMFELARPDGSFLSVRPVPTGPAAHPPDTSSTQ